MEVETTIAEDIRITDHKAQLDAACKRLLAIKIILAWMMKSCLEECRISVDETWDLLLLPDDLSTVWNGVCRFPLSRY